MSGFFLRDVCCEDQTLFNHLLSKFHLNALVLRPPKVAEKQLIQKVGWSSFCLRFFVT